MVQTSTKPSLCLSVGAFEVRKEVPEFLNRPSGDFFCGNYRYPAPYPESQHPEKGKGPTGDCARFAGSQCRHGLAMQKLKVLILIFFSTNIIKYININNISIDIF